MTRNQYAICLWIVACLLSLTGLLIEPVCAAAEYWVSTAGNDSWPGACTKPFRTIQHAVDAAKAGDSVLVKAGRYEENVYVATEKSGMVDKWLTISAAPGDERKAIVGTETPRVDAYGSQSSAFSLQQVKYVRVRGFYCVAPYRGRGSGIGISRSQYIEILDCVVTGGGQGGVDANHCDYVTIDGVEAFFNGGGSGWSSGISLLEPKTKKNVVRNCICYGNFDNSSYRSDGNGIIIDNGYSEGGALLANNLCYMNGGKGICSTRSNDCTFLHNTSTANCWQSNQRAMAHELSIRGAGNVVRNNIAVSRLPNGVGMQALLKYGGPMGNVIIDPKTIQCDHNLFFNPAQDACVVIAGNRRETHTLETLKKSMLHWSSHTLSVDPDFVDPEDLDFRLRPDSPAVRAGIASSEVRRDLLGNPRPSTGACSLGCYEGGYAGPTAPNPTPGIDIATGEDHRAIKKLLDNEYELEWQGMLWGWGKLLHEELPLVIEIQGPRRADFLALSGRCVLKDLLNRLVQDHQVRLVVRQPTDCQRLSTGPHAISRWLSVREEADAGERAFVRRILRSHLWTQDDRGKTPFAEVLPALSAALGISVESNPPLSPDQAVPMVTRNMRLSAALNDVARRLNVHFALSQRDPLADTRRVQIAELDKPFGKEDGIVELTVEQPDGRGRIDLFARVQPNACLNARLFDDNSRLISPAGIDDTGAGNLYHKTSTRLDPDTRVRFAVIGSGCALSIGNQWVVLNQVPRELIKGGFHVRVVSEWIKVGEVRYVSM